MQQLQKSQHIAVNPTNRNQQFLVSVHSQGLWVVTTLGGCVSFVKRQNRYVRYSTLPHSAPADDCAGKGESHVIVMFVHYSGIDISISSREKESDCTVNTNMFE